MIKRPYGKNGDQISIVGLGGIVVAHLDQPDADRIARDAFDRGVTYYDVAPSYGDAEDRLGPAIQPFRDAVFVACKTEMRTRPESDTALETSLRKMRTDRFDLYQLHGVADLATAQQCCAPGGALETVLAARDKGLTRYIGFSAHSVDAALFLMDQAEFDSVLFPINYATYLAAAFGPQVVEKALAKGMSVLSLKAMAMRAWPDGADRAQPKCWYQPHTDRAAAALALRWALSLPITAAVPPGDPDVFRMAVEIAEAYEPLSPDEELEVQRMAHEHSPLFGAEA